MVVWHVRRTTRNLIGKDIFDTSGGTKTNRHKLRNLYLKIDDQLIKKMPRIQRSTPRKVAMKRIRDTLEHELGYDFYEIDTKRPWGGYFRITDSQINKFLADFFPGLTQQEARLGNGDMELSPKIMVVLPSKRLSWQYHDRRAERWHFITEGMYYRSSKDVLPKPVAAKPGTIVQFAQGERHRGAATLDKYALIAEIWQHTDPNNPSNEADITRLEDDFSRPKH